MMFNVRYFGSIATLTHSTFTGTGGTHDPKKDSNINGGGSIVKSHLRNDDVGRKSSLH